MAWKLYNIFVPQPKYLLEFPSDLHQSFPGGAVSILTTASRLGPQADPEKRFTNVNNDTHDFLVILRLESLANGS